MTYLPEDKQDPFTGTVPQAINSTFVLTNDEGFSTIAFTMTIPTGGTVLFQCTYDGTNWVPLTLLNFSSQIYNSTSTVSGTFIGSIAGARSFRIFVSVGGSADGSITGTVSRDESVIEAIKSGPPTDYETQVAQGKIVGDAIVNKNGVNFDVDTGTLPEDIIGGGGLYTGFPLTTVDTISFVSTDAADAAAGIGARTIRIVGLDTNWNIQTEVVTMNGLTPVATVNQYRRAHSAFVLTAGSNDFNVGTITGYHTGTPTNVFLYMRPTTNQTYMSAYTVPAGKTAYLRNITASITRSGSGGIVNLREAELNIAIREFNAAWRLRRPFSITNNTPAAIPIYGGLVLPEKTDIVVRCTFVSNDNTSISAGYDLILIDN